MARPDSLFLRNMCAVAIPVALQNLISSSLSFVDTAMISTLGEDSIAGVGLVTQYFVLFFCIGFAVASTAGVFYARFFVSEKREEMRGITALGTWMMILVSLLFMGAGFFAPRAVLGLYTQDPALIQAGSEYLVYLVPGFVVYGISMIISSGFRTTGMPRLPLITSIISFAANVFLNWVLIFGMLGAPRMGVAGAALATTLSRFLEFALNLILMLKTNAAFRAGLAELFRLQKALVMPFIRVMLPIFLTDFFWGLAQNLLQKAYAEIGTTALAAMQLGNTVENLLFIFIRGVSSASVVTIGGQLGLGLEDKAKEEASQYVKVAVALGVLLGLPMILFPQLFLIFFDLDTELLRATSQTLIRIRGAFLIAKFMNDVLLAGILRAGADSLFVFFAEGFVTWALVIPGAFLGAMLFRWDIVGTFLLVTALDNAKLLMLYPRYRKEKWIRSVE